MKNLKTIIKAGGAMAITSLLYVMPTFAANSQSARDRAAEGLSNVNEGSNTDLMGSIRLILNAVFGVVGMIAVVMIILGGISYATSQGDPGKVKKGKDTILYGIIGLVITLLAFAIVTFVLNALQ